MKLPLILVTKLSQHGIPKPFFINANHIITMHRAMSDTTEVEITEFDDSISVSETPAQILALVQKA